MIEYDGIVFITDNCLQYEVTYLPSLLRLHEIDEDTRTVFEGKSVVTGAILHTCSDW
jgi:hypothetical protein